MDRMRISSALSAASIALSLVACDGPSTPLPIPNDGSPIQGAYFRPLKAEPAPARNLFATWGDGDGTLWAVGEAGLVARLVDGAWEPMESGTSADLRGVWGRGPDDVYAVGTGGTILHFRKREPIDETEDPAEIEAEWVVEASPVDVDLNAVAGGGDNLYAVGLGGTILSRDDEGEWTALEDPPTVEAINGLLVDRSGRAVAVGNLGLILRADKDGNWWRQRIDGLNKPLRSVWGPNTDRFYIVGLEGTVLRGGPDQSIESIPGAPKVFLRSVWGTSMGDAWAVGWNGSVVHLDGQQASVVKGVTESRLEGVWGSWVVDPVTEEGAPVFYLVGVNGTVLVGPEP